MNGKQAVKNILAILLGKRFDALGLKRIQEASVISFDVFDTLVVRDCSSPAVVFDIVERCYNASHPSAKVMGFRDARKAAERKARGIVPSGEPSIFEIYALLDERFSKAAPDLLSFELDTELRICRTNPEAKALYDALLAMGKRIAIASDMYLGSDEVGKILAKCGYAGYERLYVSSDAGITKRNGHLFQRMAKDMNVACKDILHVGDHVLSDYLVPKRLGLRSFLYRQGLKQQGLFASRYGYKGDSLANDVLGAVIANRIDAYSEDVRDWMGYAVLGPLLYGYITWLREMWTDEGRPGILFLSREGAILMQAWNHLFGEGGPARYANVSRLALCRAMAGRAKSYDQLFDIFSCLTRGCKTLGDYFDLLGADPGSVPFKRFGLARESPFPSSDKEAVYHLVKQHCNEFFSVQHDLLVDYLQIRTRFEDASNSTKNLIICDIGWSGTMQVLLQQALPSKKTIGAYLAVSDFQNDEARTLRRHELDRRGYWCDVDRWDSDGRVFRFTQSAIETLFLNSEGSTVSYTRTADGVAPVKEEGGCLGEAEQSAARLHAAALAFIDDCRSANLQSLIGAPGCETVLLPYINTVVRPTSKALEFYSRVTFVNGIKEVGFLPLRGLPYYLTHPREAIRELELNNSKVLWLKGLLKLPLPYFQFLCFLTSKVDLKSEYAKSIEPDSERDR
ncbi:MAG TPA: hypothetical protein DCP91_13735 [Eggerthellaceae bacterium]|nr:hypothetical protein [Eggerthellaceae bacterium]